MIISYKNFPWQNHNHNFSKHWRSRPGTVRQRIWTMTIPKIATEHPHHFLFSNRPWYHVHQGVKQGKLLAVEHRSGILWVQVKQWTFRLQVTAYRMAAKVETLSLHTPNAVMCSTNRQSLRRWTESYHQQNAVQLSVLAHSVGHKAIGKGYRGSQRDW